MIVDRSDAAVVKPLPRYPDYQYIQRVNGRDQILPDDVINQLQIPPPANRVAQPQITPPVIPTPNGGPPAGFPAWAKIAIGVAGVLFLIGGVRA